MFAGQTFGGGYFAQGDFLGGAVFGPPTTGHIEHGFVGFFNQTAVGRMLGSMLGNIGRNRNGEIEGPRSGRIE